MTTKTVIHTPAYTSHAYTIARLASKQLQDKVTVLHYEIQGILGSSIWLTPSNGFMLHF